MAEMLDKKRNCEFPYCRPLPLIRDNAIICSREHLGVIYICILYSVYIYIYEHVSVCTYNVPIHIFLSKDTISRYLGHLYYRFATLILHITMFVWRHQFPLTVPPKNSFPVKHFSDENKKSTFVFKCIFNRLIVFSAAQN